MLYDIMVSLLRGFETFRLNKGNSKNTIGIYLRAIRSIYNSAISEDQFVPLKNVFQHYKNSKGQENQEKGIVKR